MYKKLTAIIGAAALGVMLVTLALRLAACGGDPVPEPAQTQAAGSMQFNLNNLEVAILSSDGRITTTNSSDLNNWNHSGLILFVDITGRDGSTTLTPNLHVQEPIEDNYVTVWTAAAALNSADTTAAYLFYPSTNTDAAALYTEAVDLTIGKVWRVAMTHSDTDPITYTVSCVLMR